MATTGEADNLAAPATGEESSPSGTPENSQSGADDEKAPIAQGGWMYMPGRGWVQTEAKSAADVQWAKVGKRYSQQAATNDPMHQKVRQYATQVLYMAQKPKWGRDKESKKHGKEKKSRGRTREKESRTMRLVGVVKRSSSVPAAEDRKKVIKEQMENAGAAAAAGIAAGMAAAVADQTASAVDASIPSKEELNDMGVKALKTLAKDIGCDISMCVEKKDLVDALDKARDRPVSHTMRSSSSSALRGSMPSGPPKTKEELLRLRKSLESKRKVHKARDLDDVTYMKAERLARVSRQYHPDVTHMHMGGVDDKYAGSKGAYTLKHT